jgi:hypothetical protein
MASNEGRRWTMDDAWWLDPPTIEASDPPRLEDGEAADSGDGQMLWADDAGAWEDEPLTSPGVGDGGGGGAGMVGPPPLAPGEQGEEVRKADPEIDPLWAYF